MTKKEAKNKRQAIGYYCITVLNKEGINYTTNNNGIHLIIKHNKKVIDYYPTTGKWKDRKGWRGWGIKSLLKHIENPHAVIKS